MRKELKKAFTLIELLVIVAIMGILATVVIINVSKARIKAIEAKVSVQISEANKEATICVANGDGLVQYSTINQMNGQVICDNLSTTNAVWPNLSSLGWYYFAFTPAGTTWTGKAQNTDAASPRSITFTNAGTQSIVTGGAPAFSCTQTPPASPDLSFTPPNDQITLSINCSPTPPSIHWDFRYSSLTCPGNSLSCTIPPAVLTTYFVSRTAVNVYVGSAPGSSDTIQLQWFVAPR